MTDASPTEAPEHVAPVAVLSALPDGQAALFEDPRRLLGLEVSELRQVGAEVARESGSVLARVRRANGLVAWAMWYQSTELAYADWERGQAEELSVSPHTLRRWRRDVVTAESLPVPTVAALRAEATREGLRNAAKKAIEQELPPASGFYLYRLWTPDARLLYVGVSTRLRQRLRSHQRHFGTEMGSATWQEFDDASSMLAAELAAIRDECPAINKIGTDAPDRLPPDPERRIQPGPGVAVAAAVANAARLPDPGPPPSTRAAIAHLIDHLHALDPSEAGAAMTAAQLDIVLDWAEHAAKAAPRRKAATARKPKPPAARGDACPHPINRRIGSGCGACGVDPVAK